MGFEVRIPPLGESVTEGVIVRWAKANGERVEVDDVLLELETDKASVEIPAERAGVLRILRAAGERVHVGEVVAEIARADGTAAGRAAREASGGGAAGAEPAAGRTAPLSPAAQRLVEEHRLDAGAIAGTGRGGRIMKEDVLAHIAAGEACGAGPAEPPPAPAVEEASPARAAPGPRAAAAAEPGRAADEERVPMSPLRRRIAERLVAAQRTAAILTTFNEVDMSAVMELRARHKARFAEAHGVGLGFVSFFARACIAALHDIPVLNASIAGPDVVYRKRVHLGIAVATRHGLVVPVVHDADLLSFAAIEKEIERLAARARDGKLTIDDLSGGTFTITNGGVFGSLLSTPLLNPPQSGILGMHKIEKRPVVVDDQVAIRPMMYVALSYDHRLVDGEQAVTFLVRVKERIEDPARLLLGV